MQVTVKKWGNSVGVRIPSMILDTLAIQAEHLVDIRAENGKIVIEPIRPANSYQLQDLVAQITPDNLHSEVSTGQVVGNEV
ncbi:PbsX family transcriptional regulator [Haemophilus paracuniculus]|uniref:PbsX family transcriptional regulator n=1 Tax=Haemophilus paracuniculus TaxID=734 RepID=A0A1T0AQV7_9PAST|nr:PbsX family transcriptional regulator [Haemophilus paracuniculus]OOR98437.1 PbsX family transcriptional regulator [Haemophilus paracuniculus]